jgi:hypothetical protein
MLSFPHDQAPPIRFYPLLPIAEEWCWLFFFSGMTNRKEISAEMDYEQIQVEFYSGYKAIVRPLVFEYQEQRWEVEEILDRWYEGGLDASKPEISYFKVRTSDGQVFLLRYLSLFDAWSVRV